PSVRPLTVSWTNWSQFMGDDLVRPAARRAARWSGRYLTGTGPFFVIWNWKKWAPIRSPCELKLIGSPKTDVFRFVLCSSFSTSARVALPSLHARPIASTTTWPETYASGPNAVTGAFAPYFLW